MGFNLAFEGLNIEVTLNTEATKKIIVQKVSDRMSRDVNIRGHRWRWYAC